MEDPRNIMFVCPEHKPKPNAHWQSMPPEFFIGKSVKLGFPLKQPKGDNTHEHMWVKVLRLHDGPPPEELVGELDNDPIYDVGYVCGDWVGFARYDMPAQFGYCSVALGAISYRNEWRVRALGIPAHAPSVIEMLPVLKAAL